MTVQLIFIRGRGCPPLSSIHSGFAVRPNPRSNIENTPFTLCSHSVHAISRYFYGAEGGGSPPTQHSAPSTQDCLLSSAISAPSAGSALKSSTSFENRHSKFDIIVARHTPHTRRTHAAHTPHTRRTHGKSTRNTPQTRGNTRKHTRFFFPRLNLNSYPSMI